jgi:HK97 family phage portal protein
MKQRKLNGLQKAVANLFGLPTVMNLPTVQQRSPFFNTIGFNNGVSIYPYGKDLTYINQGYNKNAWVYSIVSKCAKKFGQVPWYHYKIKTQERKTWAEYQQLTKDLSFVYDVKAQIELRKMRTKAVDEVVKTSPLSALIQKPNANQARAAFMENLYGYKLLTGEGNIWIPREENEKPTVGVIVPKLFIGLVKGSSPWDIAQYRMLFPGNEIGQSTDNIISWKFPNYNFDTANLTHLRGQSPLDAGLLTMQASNEGTERMAAMNHNQGVAGAVFDKARREYPTVEQAGFIRQQFNEIVNDNDLAGQIAWLTGDLGYIQFGLDAGQLQLLEQSDVQFKTLCNIYDVPWQLFGTADSYENRKQYKRDFVYDNIAVAAYGLRDELNSKLLPAFNLDRDRDVIDCDVMALPELSEDLKTQAETLSKLWQLTPNQVLEYIGYDPSPDPNMNVVYAPSGFVPLKDLNMDMGSNLDSEMNALNE